MNKIYAESTLKGFTKEQLIGIIRCLEHNLSVAEERNSNQFKLLMKKEKYRWHDLRKNPDDLPPLGKKVVCYFMAYNTWTIGMAHYHEKGWRIDDCNLDNWYLMAWREIEPFEEVK